MLDKSFAEEQASKGAKNLHQNDAKSQPIIGQIIQLYFFIVGAFALPARLLLHENFGERSISPTALAVSFFGHIWFLWNYMFMTIGILSVTVPIVHEVKNTNDTLSDFEGTVYFILIFVFHGCFFYLLEVFILKPIKHYRKIIAHKNYSKGSYYRGDLKYFKNYLGTQTKTILGHFHVDEEILRLVIEPRKIIKAGLQVALILYILAQIVGFLANGYTLTLLAIYLMTYVLAGLLIAFSGICLFLEELGYRLRLRSAALDMIDSKNDLALILAEKERIEDTTILQSDKDVLEDQPYTTVQIVINK